MRKELLVLLFRQEGLLVRYDRRNPGMDEQQDEQKVVHGITIFRRLHSG